MYTYKYTCTYRYTEVTKLAPIEKLWCKVFEHGYYMLLEHDLSFIVEQEAMRHMCMYVFMYGVVVSVQSGITYALKSSGPETDRA